MPDLGALLRPRSVAVIGASPNRHIIRGRIMHALGCHPFPGPIYPISRSHESIDGHRAYRSVGEVPGEVDLAVFVIPAGNVPDALEECGRAGVRAAMIISSGFAEEPGTAGQELQQRIRDIATRYDMAIGGPNSEGFMNALLPLCATFSPTVDDPETPLMPPARRDGYIAVTAQSGGIGFSFFDRGQPKELPFCYVVTTGNEACLSGAHFVDHMLDEGSAEVFIMFMEDVKDPATFQHAAEKALRAGKPVIATKIGRSDAGQRAAASHTAALTGSYEAYRAMFQRYGVIEGYDIEEIVDIAAGFSYWRTRLPAGRRVGIVTGSGGGGGWMADSCVAAGLEVPELDPETRAHIDKLLPPYGTSQNPVDGTAQAIRTVGYGALAGMVGQSPVVDSIVVVTSARNAAGYDRERENLEKVARETEKPILFCSYTRPRGEATALLGAAGYPLYTNMRNCARTVALMAEYRATRERFLRVPEVTTEAARVSTDIRAKLEAAGRMLCEYQAMELLAAYGIPAGQARLARNAAEAAEAADSFGGAVALKVQSPDIPHKTEAGGVALGVTGPDATAAAFERILSSARQYRADADIHGVLVQPMARRGREVILGVNRDATFGPMLMVGLGGVFVEVLKDVAFAPVPLTAPEAETLLQRLKGVAILDGVRGEKPADRAALIDLMVKLSRFAADTADLVAEIDLNPVIVHPESEGLTIVDALIVRA